MFYKIFIEPFFQFIMFFSDLFKSKEQKWNEYVEWKDRFNKHKSDVRKGLKDDKDAY